MLGDLGGARKALKGIVGDQVAQGLTKARPGMTETEKREVVRETLDAVCEALAWATWQDFVTE